MPQTQVARTIYNFWIEHGLKPHQAIAFVGNAMGEESLKDPVPVGDHGTAYGIFQWHWEPRGEAIFKAIGIDVRKASIEDQCKAALWELTTKMPKAMAKIKAASTAYAAVTILVRDVERPKNPSSDITKRTAYVTTWAKALGVN